MVVHQLYHAPPVPPVQSVPQPPYVMPPALPLQLIVPPAQLYSFTANSASSYSTIKLVKFQTGIHR